MAQQGRTYNALGEEERRFQVFRDNLRYIDQHNTAADAGLHSFRLGLNRFADITNEEYRARYLGVRSKPERQRKLSARYQADDSEVLPESFDWREKGAVVDVKDQGDCGENLICCCCLSFFHRVSNLLQLYYCIVTTSQNLAPILLVARSSYSVSCYLYQYVKNTN
jgi:hypothetical protein